MKVFTRSVFRISILSIFINLMIASWTAGLGARIELQEHPMDLQDENGDISRTAALSFFLDLFPACSDSFCPIPFQYQFCFFLQSESDDISKTENRTFQRSSQSFLLACSIPSENLI